MKAEIPKSRSSVESELAPESCSEGLKRIRTRTYRVPRLQLHRRTRRSKWTVNLTLVINCRSDCVWAENSGLVLFSKRWVVLLEKKKSLWSMKVGVKFSLQVRQKSRRSKTLRRHQFSSHYSTTEQLFAITTAICCDNFSYLKRIKGIPPMHWYLCCFLF